MTPRQDIDNLGALLKQWRNRLRVTQLELGEQAGCDASTISRIEHNSYRPSQDVLKGIRAWHARGAAFCSHCATPLTAG